MYLLAKSEFLDGVFAVFDAGVEPADIRQGSLPDWYVYACIVLFIYFLCVLIILVECAVFVFQLVAVCSGWTSGVPGVS